jgi:hypothetical protein
MLFGQDRDELRRMYVDAWRKAQNGELLSPLEAQIAAVVEDHPEYRKYLAEDAVEADFRPESGQTNPFLHMGLHLSLRDQVKTDRPPGIRRLYERVAARCRDEHEAEHQLIDCLAEALWEAQNRNEAPDEQRYLERVRALLA